MRYSARWLLILAMAAAVPACGGSGGSPAVEEKGKPPASPTGSPDPLFGLTGAVVRNPSATSDGVVAMRADAVALYIVSNGAVDQADQFGQIEKRSLTTGALVPGF